LLFILWVLLVESLSFSENHTFTATHQTESNQEAQDRLTVFLQEPSTIKAINLFVEKSMEKSGGTHVELDYLKSATLDSLIQLFSPYVPKNAEIYVANAKGKDGKYYRSMHLSFKTPDKSVRYNFLFSLKDGKPTLISIDEVSKKKKGHSKYLIPGDSEINQQNTMIFPKNHSSAAFSPRTSPMDEHSVFNSESLKKLNQEVLTSPLSLERLKSQVPEGWAFKSKIHEDRDAYRAVTVELAKGGDKFTYWFRISKKDKKIMEISRYFSQQATSPSELIQYENEVTRALYP